MPTFATVVLEVLDGSTWRSAVPQDIDFGEVDAGTTSSVLDLRVRNWSDDDRTGVGFYLAPETAPLMIEDRVVLLDWGDVNQGLQIQQKTGPGPGDWGSWSSFKTGVGDSEEDLVLLSKDGVDPAQSEDGDLPAILSGQFRIRIDVPSFAPSRSRRYKPRLKVKYA